MQSDVVDELPVLLLGPGSPVGAALVARVPHRCRVGSEVEEDGRRMVYRWLESLRGKKKKKKRREELTGRRVVCERGGLRGC